MDELYTYAKRKNKIYVITLVNREKRQIVDYDTRTQCHSNSDAEQYMT